MVMVRLLVSADMFRAPAHAYRNKGSGGAESSPCRHGRACSIRATLAVPAVHFTPSSWRPKGRHPRLTMWRLAKAWMPGLRPTGVKIRACGSVVTTVSWPGLARPSTTGGADRGRDVDGWHKAGHDTKSNRRRYFNAYGACA